MRASGLLGLVLVTLPCRGERARLAGIVSRAFTQELPRASLPKDC